MLLPLKKGIMKSIEWCDETWNPVWGCRRGCEYCFARLIARRFGKTAEQRSFMPMWIDGRLQKKFKKSTKIVFVNSMSDIDCWLPEWMDAVLKKIKDTPATDFVFLTKDLSGADYYGYDFPMNTYCGVTITGDEDPDDDELPPYAYLLPDINNKLLNVEPLLAPVMNPYNNPFGFRWVIIGGLTNYKKYKTSPPYSPQWEWISDLVRFCRDNRIPVFMKETIRAIVPPEQFTQEFPGRI